MEIITRAIDCLRGAFMMGLGFTVMSSVKVSQAVTIAANTISTCAECQNIVKYIPFSDSLTVPIFIMIVGVLIIISGVNRFMRAFTADK